MGGVGNEQGGLAAALRHAALCFSACPVHCQRGHPLSFRCWSGTLRTPQASPLRLLCTPVIPTPLPRPSTTRRISWERAQQGATTPRCARCARRDRKMMSTLCHGRSRYVLYVKGAPEAVLARCTRALTSEGQEVPLTEAMREDMAARVGGGDRLGGQGGDGRSGCWCSARSPFWHPTGPDHHPTCLHIHNNVLPAIPTPRPNAPPTCPPARCGRWCTTESLPRCAAWRWPTAPGAASGWTCGLRTKLGSRWWGWWACRTRRGPRCGTPLSSAGRQGSVLGMADGSVHGGTGNSAVHSIQSMPHAACLTTAHRQRRRRFAGGRGIRRAPDSALKESLLPCSAFCKQPLPHPLLCVRQAGLPASTPA